MPHKGQPRVVHSEETKKKARELRRRGWGYKRIAAYLGVGPGTVVYWLNPESREKRKQSQHDYKVAAAASRREARSAQLKPKTCPDCGKEFQPNSGRQVRCEECRKKPRKRTPYTIRGARKRRAAPTLTDPQARHKAHGEELRNSPLALSIEERVRKAYEEMGPIFHKGDDDPS